MPEETKVKELTGLIANINNLLKKVEPEAIQEIKGAGGRIMYGYKPQYIIDALNAFYPLWKMDYKVLEQIQQKNSTLSIVEVEIEIEGIKRKQIGQSTNMNAGDSLKGAITDGIAKALSLFSIGNRAFRGELGQVKSQQLQPKPQTKQEKEPSPQVSQNTISEKQQKRLFAIAKQQGWNVEDLKELLNLIGYKHSNEILKNQYDKIIDFIENNKSSHEDLKTILKLKADKEGLKGSQLLNFLGDVDDNDIYTALTVPDVWEQIKEDYKEEMKKLNPEMDF